MAQWKLSLTALAVSGDYAYAIETALFQPRSTLLIIDLRDDARPLLITRYPLPGYATDIAISGSIAYLTKDDTDELLLLDISDTLQPRPRGRITVQHLPFWVAVFGTVAYTMGSAGTVVLVDVADPNHLAIRGMFTPARGGITDVSVIGTYAFMANSDGGLTVVDVSDSSSPVEVGSLVTPGSARVVVASGTTAYLADGPNGLIGIDIGDPHHPALRWRLPLSPAVMDVQVAGDRAYAAAGGAGLQVLDLSPATEPTPLGEYALPARARDVQVADQIAYVADGDNRQLLVLDLHDRARPVPLGRVALPGSALGLTVSDGRAYVSMGADGLEIVDLRDPRQPQRLGHYDTAGAVVDVQVVGTTAYVAASVGGWRILDVTTPQAPVERFSESTTPSGSADVTAIWATASRAYLAGWSTGLRVFDVTDPSKPQLLGGYATSYYPSTPISMIESITVNDTSAVVGGAQLRPNGRYPPTHVGVVVLLDLADPQSPVVQASLVDEASGSIDVQDSDGDRVLISRRDGGGGSTTVLDTSVPGTLRPLASTQSCPGVHLDLQNTYVYSAGEDLCILELRPLLPTAYLPVLHW